MLLSAEPKYGSQAAVERVKLLLDDHKRKENSSQTEVMSAGQSGSSSFGNKSLMHPKSFPYFP